MNSIHFRNRRGLSLLEVILAIAILGGSLAVISELVRIGILSAIETRMRSEANILCDAKMAEVSAGVIELNPVAPTIIAEKPQWLYAVNVEPSPGTLGLLVVTVTVEQAAVANPVSMSIVRFMPDPDYEPVLGEEESG